MSVSDFNKFDVFQVKTSPKGIYLFFSLTSFLFAFKMLKILPASFEEIFIQEKIVENSIILILLVSWASVFSAFLYYVQIENFILSGWFKLKNKGNYRNYRRVTLKDCFNHPFIAESKKRFYSLIYFLLSIVIFYLTYMWHLDYIAILLILLIFIILWIALIYINKKILHFRKKKFSIFWLSLSIFYCIFIINAVYNPISLLLFVMIAILPIYSYIRWKDLEIKAKLIYLKSLFIQKRSKDYFKSDDQRRINLEFEDISSFIESVESGIWSEAKIFINKILDYVYEYILSEFNPQINALSKFIQYLYSEYEKPLNTEKFYEKLRKGLNKPDSWNINYQADHKSIANQTFQLVNEIYKLKHYVSDFMSEKYYLYVFIIFNPYTLNNVFKERIKQLNSYYNQIVEISNKKKDLLNEVLSSIDPHDIASKKKINIRISRFIPTRFKKFRIWEKIYF